MFHRRFAVCSLTVAGALALCSPAFAGTLSANPDPLFFNPQPYYFGGQSQGVQIANSNDTATAPSGATFTGPDASAFYIAWGNNCVTPPQSYGPGNTCDVGIGFNPPGPGTFTAALEISYDDTNSPLVVSLSATALQGPQATITPATVAFGAVPIGQEVATAVTVSNSGDAPLQVQQALVVTGRPEVFFVTDNTCTFQIIDPGGSCTIVAHFKPSFAGPQDASLFLITGNAAQPVTSVGLNGAGVGPPVPIPPPAVADADLAIRVLGPAGPVRVGDVTRWRLDVSNAGPATATGVRVTATPTGGATVPAARIAQVGCAAGPPVECSLETLAPGASRTILVDVRPTRRGTLTLAGSVRGNEPDTRSDNIADAAGVRVLEGRTSLAVATTPRVRSARGAGRFTLTVTVRNAGRRPARDVRVCQRLPAALVVRRLGGARVNAGVPCWRLGSLAAGAKRRFVLAVRSTCGRRRVTVTATARAANARPQRDSDTLRIGCGLRAPRFTG